MKKVAKSGGAAVAQVRCRRARQVAWLLAIFNGLCLASGCDTKPAPVKTEEQRKVFYGEKPTAEQIRQANEDRNKRGGGPPPEARGEKKP